MSMVSKENRLVPFFGMLLLAFGCHRVNESPMIDIPRVSFRTEDISKWPEPTQDLSNFTGIPTRISHTITFITLFKGNPSETNDGISLVRVEQDGTSVIHVAKTNETIAAKIGQSFLGKRDESGIRTFGENGLVLNNADFEKQWALLLRFAAEYSFGTKQNLDEQGELSDGNF